MEEMQMEVEGKARVESRYIEFEISGDFPMEISNIYVYIHIIMTVHI